LSVTGEEHTHLKVSRTQKGEGVEVFDGTGCVWEGEVLSCGRESTRVRVSAQRSEPSPRAELILAQALVKNRAFEWALEKAVEVGVTRIIPFRASRSKVGQGGRDKRWSRIVIEAAKQSKHYHLPRLDPIVSIDEVFSVSAKSKIVFALGTTGSLESAISGQPVLYLIGPEGGWAPDELESARERGFHEVSLGTHVLRSETAAVVAGGLIAHELGVS
jgi:16S rRNA (uracil1498-N3)-methyltransferase